jgi:hypothetical protein
MRFFKGYINTPSACASLLRGRPEYGHLAQHTGTYAHAGKVKEIFSVQN